jgi:hypothetical protein
MVDHHSAFSRDAAPADLTDAPRNWRSEIGVFWKDIEEAGSVVRAIRLRGPAAPEQTESGGTEGPGGSEGSVKANRWALFRTLRLSML